MTQPQPVIVIDYGVGNLFSVCRALQHIGAEPILTSEPNAIKNASCVILPGVGAFEDGMKGLQERQLVRPVIDYIATGRPFLGICLGMQMLFEINEEFGTHEGLGVIPGRVIAIPPVGADNRPHKIPHIGWNILEKPSLKPDWKGTMLTSAEPSKTRAYFVHSFTAWPSDEGHRLADTSYNGQCVSAVVKKANVYGTQFHPEKSGPDGLAMLSHFVALPQTTAAAEGLLSV